LRRDYLLQIRFNNAHCAGAKEMEIKMNSIQRLIADESGVTAIEYGVIAALISCIIIAAVGSVGTHLRSTFNSVAASL
jgi:pilus assembly protein Flp/PilA